MAYVSSVDPDCAWLVDSEHSSFAVGFFHLTIAPVLPLVIFHLTITSILALIHSFLPVHPISPLVSYCLAIDFGIRIRSIKHDLTSLIVQF